MTEKIKIGVSACLLGEKVRYDGGHKHDCFITDTLGRYMEFVPVCPEVGCGLPVPRETMQLTGDPTDPRLVTCRTGTDHTVQMASWGKFRLSGIEKEYLYGYIFKSRSPSCGMARIRVYNSPGITAHTGTGVWARMFMDHYPLLPAVEESCLHDPILREHFIERIFVYRRWREMLSRDKTPAGLIDFHTRHKMLIMSHSPLILRELGKLTASGMNCNIDELCSSYIALLSTALDLKATVRKNVNVLHHLMGYFKKRLTHDEKRELADIIDKYGRECLPLVVPVTLVNHYVGKYDQPYLKIQYYLNPNPIELMLRTHV
ncbi:DUF523 and DUF1722 domain-containing protein [bacterium]|nr:DUF523 and DUF1722 domain-containing protein [bacterium]